MNTCHRLLATVTLLAAWTTSGSAQLPAKDSTWFVTTTQSLLDAVTSGDSVVWARQLAPEWVLSDEEGERLTRQEFLKALHPLPAGQQGKLTVANVHFVAEPDVVVMSYDAEEEHHFYGQLLLTTFHQSDVYLRRGGRWQQIASQATALPRPLDGIRVAPQSLANYAGDYTLTPDITLSIAVKDSGLTMNRAGREPQPLFALDDRLFIRHGVRGFWVFERDSTGKVVDLVNWRDNNAVIWHRKP